MLTSADLLLLMTNGRQIADVIDLLSKSASAFDPVSTSISFLAVAVLVPESVERRHRFASHFQFNV